MHEIVYNGVMKFIFLLFFISFGFSASAETEFYGQYETVQRQDAEKDINICMWLLNAASDETPYQTSLLKSGHIEEDNESDNKSQVWILENTDTDEDSNKTGDVPAVESAWLEVTSTFRRGQIIDTRKMALKEYTEQAYIIDLPEKEFHFMMLDIALNGYTLFVKVKDQEEPLTYSFLPPRQDDRVITYRECLNSIPKIGDANLN